MPAKAYLIDLLSGKVLHTESYWQEGFEGKVLLVTSVPETYGKFKSATYSNETATLVSPVTDGSIKLTDLIVTSEKQVGETVTVQFYDGTNTVLIASAGADSPVQIAIGFTGGWQGWKDAYIQVIVSAAFNATVAVGYVKCPKEMTMGYDAWDALR